LVASGFDESKEVKVSCTEAEAHFIERSLVL
jgi:hypothetical protein